MSDPWAEVSIERLGRLVSRLHRDLDVLSYYNLLGVLPGAPSDEIRKAFRERALLLHPDRYYGLTDESFKEAISRVYKRVSEGYRVLTDSQRRQQYDMLVRQGILRYSEESAERLPPAEPEGSAAPEKKDPGIHHPQARQFYSYAVDAMKRQDYSDAIGHLEQALAMQPGASKIEARMAEARRLQKLYGR